MYSVENRREAIRELQRFLRTVSQINKSIPHVTVDGIYGSETKNAVIEFQRLNGIAETGTVDKNTFDRIYYQHLEIIANDQKVNAVFLEEEYPLGISDRGSNVSILNAILILLNEYYEYDALENDDYFSKSTEAAVIALKKIFRMEANGFADIAFVNRANNEINIREKFNPR